METEEASKLSFEEKVVWFRYKVESLRIPWTQGAEKIFIKK